MNTIKWVQIICSLFLVILPAAIEYRNWKHHDKRTKVHRWITAVLLTLWMFSAFGISWAMYKDFVRKEKAPAFTLYLNGLRLGSGDYVTLPLTNEITQLVFAIRNDGNVGADGVLMMVDFPGSIPSIIRVVKSEGWDQDAGVEALQNSVKISQDQVFSVQHERIVAQGDFVTCPPLYIQTSDLSETLNYMWFKATSKNSQTFRTSLTVHFKRGISKPYIGF